MEADRYRDTGASYLVRMILKGGNKMIGFVSGYSDTDDIHNCPACGASITEWYYDGTAKCCECGLRFGVVVPDEWEDGEDNA